jgi:hypothetical protein
MGREVKRVPLDFDAPLREVWEGFVRPDSHTFPPCEDCSYEELPSFMSVAFPTPPSGTGLTREAYAVSQTFYPHMIGGPMADRLAWCDKLGQAEVDMLVEERRIGFHTLWDREELPEPWEMDEGHPIRYRFVRNDNPNPTAAEVNEANRGRRGFGDGVHDALNHHLLVRFRCKQLGIEVQCKTCDGNGDIAAAEQREEVESWEGAEPPEGEGWQLWETTSEGSPISPVFAEAESLAQWMSENPCGFAGSAISLDAARSFVNGPGWAPSMMASVATGVVDGITFVASGSSVETGEQPNG